MEGIVRISSTEIRCKAYASGLRDVSAYGPELAGKSRLASVTAVLRHFFGEKSRVEM